MNVLVTGGTGFVGKVLVERLRARDEQVTILTRTPERMRDARPGVSYAAWPVDVAAFDAIVNLAGAGIADRRWTEAYKRELRASRIDGTRRLVDAMSKSSKRPSVLVSASAVGYYGDRGEEELPESARPADDFLARLCVEWEAEAERARRLGVRVVTTRSGHVLGPDGGALEPMRRAFAFGLGGPFGNGRQWMPWIHVDDVASLVIHAIDHGATSGPLNAVAPGVVRQREFARTLGRVMSRPAIVPAPRFALRIVLGELADALLASARAVPERTLATAFAFRFPELEPALRDVLKEE